MRLSTDMISAVKKVYISAAGSEDNVLCVEVSDTGRRNSRMWKRPCAPCITTRPEQDRSGMGFAFMEAFMDQCGGRVRAGQRDNSEDAEGRWKRKGDMDHTIALIRKITRRG